MKRRYKLTRSLASAATLLSAGGLAGIAMAPSASATTAITSTWAGGGTVSNGTGGTNPDPSWSNTSNWSAASGDSPPTSGSTIGTLTFPDLPSCDSEFQNNAGVNTTACYMSMNDLSPPTPGSTSLTAGTIEIDNPPVPAGANTAPGYSIGGNAITLTGGLNVTGDSGNHSPASFSIPLTLSGTSQTWSMPGSTVDLSSDVGGAGTDVTVQASEAPSTSSTNLQLDGHVETKSFTLSGQDSTKTGTNAGNNGFLELNNADVNGTNSNAGTGGNPVNITNGELVGAGSVGSLTVTGGDVSLQQTGGSSNGPAVLATGGAAFDANSEIDFDMNGTASTTVTAGTDYSQLTAAKVGSSGGAIQLGGALLTLSHPNDPSITCVDPKAGTVYTLAQGTSLSGTVSFDYGGSVGPVSPASVVSIPSCDNSTNDQFRIDYTSTALTATALDATTTTVTAASDSPQINQPDLVTATISAASGATPTGKATFRWEDATDASTVCSDVALVNGKATCNVAFPVSGTNSVEVDYTPAGATNFAPSVGFHAVQVAPISGASSSNSATASGSTTSATATNPDNGVSATASGGNGTVTTSNYGSDPVTAPTFNSDGTYFDVQLSSGSTFNSVTISVPNVPAGGAVYWYNPSGGWTKVVGDTGSTQSPYAAVIDSVSSPKITQLQGTVFGVAAPGSAPAPSGHGYSLVASDGGVFTFGGAGYYGSTGAQHLNAPIVGMATTPDHGGYWLVGSDGGVFTFGDAKYFGSMGAVHLNKPVVGIAATPTGKGYYLVASDGGIFTFGDAKYYGSTGAIKLNKPVVGMGVTPDGGGYYLVASDGGIFTFGDAKYAGSTGAQHLNQPVVGMAVDPVTGGYWLVASDGGIFTFNAPFAGSTGAQHLNKPIVGMASDPTTGGYFLVASDGGIFTFNTPFFGSTGAQRLNAPVVGAAMG